MKLKNSIANYFLIFIVMASVFTACSNKENPKPIPPVISQDSARAIDKQVMTEKIQKMMGDSAKVIEPGRFQSDSTIRGVVVGKEIAAPKQWGIRFVYFKDQNNNLNQSFQSPLLNGSFKGSMVRKIKLASSNYEMIYYDSQDLFLGSGGGEIFSYVIDLDKNKIYSAHFFTVPQKPVSLFISPNTDNQEVRDIFLKHFRKDYPDLKLVSKDYNLEDIF